MGILLKKIVLQNYRSCKKTEFYLDKNLSALIGINGAGKSNILNGIMLLRKLALSSHTGNQDKSLLFNCVLKASLEINKFPIEYKAQVSYTTSDRNNDDVIDSIESWDISSITGSNKHLQLSISSIKQVSRMLGLSINKLSDRADIFFTLAKNAFGEKLEIPEASSRSTIIDIFTQFYNFVSKFKYYSASRFTDPSKCPAYFELESGNLSKTFFRAGGEHLQFLYDLYLKYKEEDDNKFQEYLSIVGPDGINLVEEIKFTEAKIPSNTYQVYTGGKLIKKEIEKILIIPQVKIKGTVLSPNQLSEGTFKTLAILFYIMTDNSQLLLLEEPEVCIHHGLLSSVVDVLCTRQNDIGL